MCEDSEGFFYPEANESCINCGLCQKVCPSLKREQRKECNNQNAYAFLTNDINEWKKSSSGAAFSAIVKSFSDENTLVFGAAWDGLSVHHISTSFNYIEPLQKSKYISSSTESTFIEAKDHLQKGYKVIYSGCPCQIAGLKSFLKKDYENLLTIDLICHGQGSPKVFTECLKDTETLIGEPVTKYEFRTKRNTYETEYLTKVTTAQGDYYLKSERYTQLFLNLLCVRPSCGDKCKYHTLDRPSDITIADCKGVEKICPQVIGEKYNYSTIVLNTEKGKAIFPKMVENAISYPIDIEDVLKYNPNLGMTSKINTPKRNEFFRDFLLDPKDAIVNKTSSTLISKRSMSWKLFELLPVSVRKFVITYYRKYIKK